ncbi:MAG: thioredoxin domain-containing protein [Myxococcota bacterium]|nr:thioredoxin domain-containing protein [Myxococcota bacterium]
MSNGYRYSLIFISLLAVGQTAACQPETPAPKQPPPPTSYNLKPRTMMESPITDGQPGTLEISTPAESNSTRHANEPEQMISAKNHATDGTASDQRHTLVRDTLSPWTQGTPARPTIPRSSDVASRLSDALAALGKTYQPRTHHHLPNGEPTYTNRLIFENSPYLLQHAHNPVDWHPWSDDAFELAKRLDRPVLMSVGYATCHWCHVMERESFEDAEIADFMNQNFVCIKVDREERPDVDSVYMDAVHMMVGRGGWPMTIIMTPDREPFFAGTYFPPRDGVRGARRGFLSILRELSNSYRTDRDSLIQRAASVSRRIAAQAQSRPGAGVPDASSIRATAERFLQMHDPTWGGFGRRPKFPRPVTLDFLLRFYRRTSDVRILNAVTKTLNRMADGGVYDQLGGGFHRYSVDERWLVPHFEKMLYDNAQLAATYLDAWQVTSDTRYASVAADILEYVSREMVDGSGAFWSATDADSEGEEGTFFIWTIKELHSILGPDQARIAIAWWGVTPSGNFEHKNILHTWKSKTAVAKSLGIDIPTLERSIESSRRQLYAHRLKREPPLTDDKILTAWNGLMISAFARGALLLRRPAFLQTAVDAAEHILTVLRTPLQSDDPSSKGRLLRTWRTGGQAKYRGYLEDYAFLVQGMLDLFEATSESRWLRTAIELTDTQIAWYADENHGGFYRTARDAEQLLARQKPNYDGAEPSGNSIAARNLLRLYEYTGTPQYRRLAEQTFRWASQRIERGGTAVPAMLGALDMLLDKPRQIFIIRGSDSDDDLLDQVIKTYLPNKALVRTDLATLPALRALIPSLEGKTARNDKSTAYVCEGGICQKPTSDPKVLVKQLKAIQPYPKP